MPEISGWWLVAWIIFSAAVQSLPDPKPEERWYGAFYKFANLVGMNLKQTFSVKQPLKK
jgi:hypothetical protein